MDSLMILATFASIVGSVFVARGKSLNANCIWVVSNAVFIWHSLCIREFEMAMLFGAYEVIAVYGIYNLTRHGGY